MEVKKFIDESENVSKFVFVKDDACYEAVLYKYPTYEERTVLCISTQCGCPVGCVFCGTGKRFVRNLTADEIVEQVFYIFEDIGLTNGFSHLLEYAGSKANSVKKLQIMFMSMGEPFLNYSAVEDSMRSISRYFPNADLLISTIGPDRPDEFIYFMDFAEMFENVGLQFSIHRAYDELRNELIPFEKKMSLLEIRNYGVEWYARTGRKVYLNYCIDDSGMCARPADYKKLQLLFPPNAFAFTFSVVCSADETMKDAGFRNHKVIEQFEQHFIDAGYDTRVFDPAGQDSIGGGCGQLWYVQQWMKEKSCTT